MAGIKAGYIFAVFKFQTDALPGNFEHGNHPAACGILRKLPKFQPEWHMKTATPPTSANPILVGLDDLGAAFQRSRWTIRRWISEHGFPAAQLPDGTWVTTHSLVERWLLSRAEDEPDII